jgi:excisionase family DNA binding protein
MRDNTGFNDKDVLTTGEVAKICNVASRTVSKWFDSGQLEGYRIPGSKDRRIPVANLMTFMKLHNIPMDGLMSGRPRVLVVDCDDEVGSTLQRVLAEEADYEVHISTNLFEAGLECERFRPHVLLFDVDMAGDLADYICNSIQECDELQGIRMVAITSRLTEGQIVQLANRGFDSVLRKPFTVRQVIEAVEQAHSVVF